MRSWREIRTSPGVPEVRSVLDPMPGPPYLIKGQHEPSFDGQPYSELKITQDFVTEIPNYYWGKVIYFVNESGLLELCAKWYDTSD